MAHYIHLLDTIQEYILFRTFRLDLLYDQLIDGDLNTSAKNGVTQGELSNPFLIHCGIVAPNGNIDLDQRWFR